MRAAVRGTRASELKRVVELNRIVELSWSAAWNRWNELNWIQCSVVYIYVYIIVHNIEHVIYYMSYMRYSVLSIIAYILCIIPAQFNSTQHHDSFGDSIQFLDSIELDNSIQFASAHAPLCAARVQASWIELSTWIESSNWTESPHGIVEIN